MFYLIFFTELSQSQSPLLMPYPSWEAHTSLSPNDATEIVSPIAIKADRCDHLWVLDAGLGDNVQLLGYDLRNANLFERFNIPKDQFGTKKPNFTSIVADDIDCRKIFVYIAVPSAPALIVYSSTEKKSWRVKHNFFSTDPLAGNFSVGNIKYQTTDGIFGLALSEAQKNGFADLYFHPITSTREFKVSTAVLRNETLSTSDANYKDFSVLGERMANGQSGASFYDRSNGVIFYTLPNLNEIGCWKITNNYTVTSVYNDPIEVTYPSDVRVTAKNQLWVLTNNMPRFLHGQLDGSVINYRILRGSVKELIKDTACEKTLVEKITKIGEKILPSTAKEPNHSNDVRPITFTISIVALWTVITTYFF